MSIDKNHYFRWRLNETADRESRLLMNSSEPMNIDDACEVKHEYETNFYTG